jgi:transcriptional regulator with XRE-family HTH domain
MRTARGISQQQLAHYLNVSPGFIGKIEGHLYHQKYSLEQINALAGIFGCSPKDFLPEKNFVVIGWTPADLPKSKKKKKKKK